MIRENLSARKYHERSELTSVYAETGTVPLEKAVTTGTYRLTWGAAYIANVIGIQVSLVATHDPLGAGDSGSATIVYPTNWDGIGTLVVPVAGYPATIRSRIEIDGARLVVNADCTWTLVFTALRWYVDNVLKLTIAGQNPGTDPASMSGINWDARESNTFLNCNAAVGTSVPGTAPACAGTYGAQDTKDHSTSAGLLGGYEYETAPGSGVYKQDPVRLDQSIVVPVVAGCTCAITPQSYSKLDSYNVTIVAVWSDTITKAGPRTETTPCIPEGGSCTATVWDVVETWTYYNGSIWIVPEDAGILETNRRADATCNGVDAVPDTNYTLTEPVTYMRYLKNIQGIVGSSVCADLTSLIFGCTHAHALCSIPGSSTLCSYSAQISLNWPTKPPCTTTGLWPWNHGTDDGRFYRADIENKDVWVFRSDTHIPPFEVATWVTKTKDCIRPAVIEDYRCRSILIYTRVDGGGNPSPKYRYSDDGGLTWSAETAVAIPNGKYAIPAPDKNGNIVLMAFVYDSGTSGDGKLYFQFWSSGVQYADIPAAAVVKDNAGVAIPVQDSTFGLTYVPHGSAPWVLSIDVVGETATSEWQCWNENTMTFKRVT